MSEPSNEFELLKQRFSELAARVCRLEAEKEPAAPTPWPEVTEAMLAAGKVVFLDASGRMPQTILTDIYLAMARLAPEPEVSEAELVAVSKLLYPRDCTLAFVRDVVEAAREARIKAHRR